MESIVLGGFFKISNDKATHCFYTIIIEYKWFATMICNSLDCRKKLFKIVLWKLR